MQAGPLLETKLHIPPLRPRLVSRPRLIGALNAALGHKLTLISAPAGFGKTTLLSEWAAGAGKSGVGVAWLSLDAGDADPARFWAYVISALQTAAPRLRRGLPTDAPVAAATAHGDDPDPSAERYRARPNPHCPDPR